MREPSTLHHDTARPDRTPPLAGKVRPLRGDDVKLYLLDLEHRFGGEDHWTCRRFEQLHRRGHGGLVFTDRNRHVIGHLTFIASAGTLLITRLLVHRDRRRQGVGYSLLGRAFSLAGTRPVYVRLHERQTDLLVFFRGWGIAKVEMSDRLRDDRDRDIILRLARQPL